MANEFIARKGLIVTGAATISSTLAVTGGVSSSLGEFGSVTITAGTITGITDLTVADGGTGVSTFTDGGVLLGSGTGAVTAMAVLANSEMIVGDGTADPVAESGATLRTSIGVGTGDSPQLTAVNVGHASDTTLARSSAGVLTVEGNRIFHAGGADVPVADGGTGASTFTDGGILLGSGTGAITATAVLADGEILIGDGTTDPVALDVGASGGISILGTVATGVWNGTAIASDNLDADTAHLTTTQTFSGAKTFSANAFFGTASDTKGIALKKDGSGATVGLDLHNAGTAGGDNVQVNWETQSQIDWSAGIERATGNWSIGRNQALGTNTALTLTAASVPAATFAGAVTVSGVLTASSTCTLTGNVSIGTTTKYCPLTVKQAAADYYGIVIEESASDGWIRMGHNGTRGAIHTTWNSSRGATPLTLGTSASVTQLVLNVDGSVSVGAALAVTGALSKGSGSFRINHPLPAKTDTHHLVHSFIEGPRADLIYRGVADLSGGSVIVALDEAAGMSAGTWEFLCRDPQVWVQNDSGWSAVRGSVEGGTLTIECEEVGSSDTVSWMVVAERCDPHMVETDWTDDTGRVIVEPEKAEDGD